MRETYGAARLRTPKNLHCHALGSPEEAWGWAKIGKTELIQIKWQQMPKTQSEMMMWRSAMLEQGEATPARQCRRNNASLASKGHFDYHGATAGGRWLLEKQSTLASLSTNDN
jgi:hypothetical protein